MGYWLLMWGFVLMANFNINGIEIIPDIFGYASMLIGCQILKESNRNFKIAGYFSVLAMVLSMSQFTPFLGIAIPEKGLIDVLGAILVMTVDLGIVYFICKGIGEIAQSMQNDQLVKLSRYTWIIYLIARISVVLVIMAIESETMIIVVFGAGILLVVSYFINIILMKKAAQDLTTYQPQVDV